MKKELTMNFHPVAGIIVVDPIDKVAKSDLVAVVDPVDDPHRGVVVAVGAPKPYEHAPDHLQKSPVEVGQTILYSIVGIEKIRVPYGDDLRHEFVIVPFIRVLGILL